MNKHQRAFLHPKRPVSGLSANIGEHLLRALHHHQQGDLEVAAAGYRAVIAVDPVHPDALHLLGVAAYQLGDNASSAELIRQSIRHNPSNSDAHSNLGNALTALGDLAGAEVAYRTASKVDPANAVAHFNLANILSQSKRRTESLRHYDLAVKNRPGFADAHFNRASALFLEGRFDEALTGYRNVLDLEPKRASIHTNIGSAYAALEEWALAKESLSRAVEHNQADALAHSNLGNVLCEMGEHVPAVSHLEQANRLAPENIEIRFGLARALMHQSIQDALSIAEQTVLRPDVRGRDWYLLGAIHTSAQRTDQALEFFERAKRLDPDSIYASNHAGLAYVQDGRIDRAISFYEEMLKRNPNDDLAYKALGIAYKDLGDIPLAVNTLRQGIEIKSDPDCHSTMLTTLYFSGEYSPERILEESKLWAATYVPNVPAAPPVRSMNGRKIRIGYLSADFHAHPAGYLYEALLPEHDRSRFEIHLYLNQEAADKVTKRIIDSADKWSIVKKCDDDELAQKVRDDKIDVLVDLLGHTDNHRLPMFGKRPAPVQVGWLGYFGTTGMDQMDYIICDRYTLPPSEEVFYTERPARMPGCMYVYQTPDVKIVPGEPPLCRNGYPTFGCFNNTAKITPEVIALWSRVMRDIPDSRMILNRWPFRTEMVRERYQRMFEENGVDGSRIEFRATKGRQPYFEVYNDVDLMLDTFPMGGGTTTSEATWMGVPVVSLTANRLVGRMTETIYHAVGLDEFIVRTPDEFVGLAKSLAGDPVRLSLLRAALRDQMETSPLCDLAQFARDLEGLYQWMLQEKVAEVAA